MPRGNRQEKRGRLTWNTKKANRGRKGAYGKRRHMATWAEVRAKMQANRTVVIYPEKTDEEEARKDETAQA